MTERPGTPAIGAPDASAGSARVLVLTGLGGPVEDAAAATAVRFAESGLDVTLVAPAVGSVRVESTLTSDAASVHVVRVPISTTLAAATRGRRSARRSRLEFAPDPVARRALELRNRLRADEAAAGASGPASSVRGLTTRLGLLSARARGYAGRRLGDAERSAWNRVDGLVGASTVGASWRRVLPELEDLELSVGHVLDRLEWDVLHAHGAAAAGLAARAVNRRRTSGGEGRWVYDIQPLIGVEQSGPGSARRHAAYGDLEREYAGSASLVVTADGAAPDGASRWGRGDGPTWVDREHLVDAYGQLLGLGLSDAGTTGAGTTGAGTTGAGTTGAGAAQWPRSRPVEIPVPRETRPSVLGIGPANMAGQAWEWGRAAERVVPGLRAEVVAVQRDSAMVFDADRTLPAPHYAGDAAWAKDFEEHVLDTWSHALFEAGRPLFGLGRGRDFTGDAAFLRSAGVEVALVMHGSEIRNPRRHAERSPWSPFRVPGETLTHRLQQKWDALHPLVLAFDGPVFVSTPDLLDEVPHAILLPVVVDVDAWTSSEPLLERERPLVVHVPSRAALKGSEHVERAMAVLTDEGLVDYRRLDAVSHDEVHRTIRAADVVVDQFSIGTYGVLAAEAMAAGRLVVSHVPQACRAAVGGDLPILEATADDLVDVLRSVLADRDAARALAGQGPAFVRALHDGRHSGAVLRDVLDLRGD